MHQNGSTDPYDQEISWSQENIPNWIRVQLNNVNQEIRYSPIDSSVSGNSPGIERIVGHFLHAENPEDLTEVPNKITPDQRSYCALRVRGVSIESSVRQLNLNRTACYRWENAEWFESVCEEERKKWLVGAGYDEKQEILLPLVPETMKAIRESLNSEDEKVKLGAAQFVLDNLFGESKKPVGRPRKAQTDQTEDTPNLQDLLAQAAAKIQESRENTPGEISLVSTSENGIYTK